MYTPIKAKKIINFLIKNTQNDKHQKDHHVNLDKSIWIIVARAIFLTNK